MDVTKLSTRELVGEYNAAARFLGEREINKFADRSAAERRTSAIVEMAESRRRAEKNVTLAQVQPVSVQASEVAASVSNAPNPEVPEDGLSASISNSTPESASETPVSAPPASSGAERWRRPKKEAASRIAYRPRAGTTQAYMYELLTTPDGIEITMFCELMKAYPKSVDKSWVAPAGVWTGLRYLFVQIRGYGLSFDGSSLKLLIPSDERDAAPRKA